MVGQIFCVCDNISTAQAVYRPLSRPKRKLFFRPQHKQQEENMYNICIIKTFSTPSTVSGQTPHAHLHLAQIYLWIPFAYMCTHYPPAPFNCAADFYIIWSSS